MHGLGNSQIIIEDLDEKLEQKTDLEYHQIAKALCHPGFGIGSDQALIILPSEEADFKMRIFNRSGGEAEMCGNGIRCVAKYLFDKNKVGKKHFIETKAGIKRLNIHEGEKKETIEVNMGNGEILEEKMKVNEFEGTFVSVGNPHFVIFTEKASRKLAEKKGPKLENAEKFQPEKANIEFAKPKANDKIETFVWERGAGLTLACGTGACATAFAASEMGIAKSKSKIQLLGGILDINIDDNEDIRMSGPAEYIMDVEVKDVPRIYRNVEKIEEG